MAINSLSTGFRPGVCTSSTRPTAPYTGQHIYETDTLLGYVWTGLVWASYTLDGVTSAVASTGISVSSAAGAVTFTNTGVTSLTGTGSQITASASTGAVTLSLPANISVVDTLTTYTGTSPMRVGSWSAAATYVGLDANKGYLLVGNTLADPHIYLRTNSAAGDVRIGGNGTNTMSVSQTTVTCGAFVSSAFQTGITYGSYGSASFLSANNNYVGFAYAGYTCAWMMNNDTFGHYRNNSFWNFYVQNGTFVSSDERWKRNISPIKYGMDFVNALQPVEYQRLTDQTDDHDETLETDIYLGFTTQQVFRALDEIGEKRSIKMVNIGGPPILGNESNDRQYLNPSEMIAPIVKSLQELDQRLKTLEGAK
jgi:hypothetical protein